MRSIKISVVIPTYRRPPLLLRCLDALLKQNFRARDYEIIVASDGDDPATADAISAMPLQKYPAIRYYALPRKAGPAAARNLGWILADAPLVAFTDDDCIPDSAWLSTMWSAYQDHRQPEIAFSGSTVVPLGPRPTDYEKNISNLAMAEFITANCACSKRALARVGGFDERFKMAWREDSDLHFKFIHQGIPVVKVPSALVTHPVRKAPWGICIREERKGMFNALLYKKYPHLYKEKIRPNLPWHYYVTVALLIIAIGGFLTDIDALAISGFAGWCAMTGWFAWKRLRATSGSWPHVWEMIFTSALIPVLSLFWRFYGSWKYKVLLVR